MSILYNFESGWVISHSEYIKNIYKDALKEDKNLNLQFKDNLFKINSPFLRFNENKNKSTTHNLKKDEEKYEINNKFSELKIIVRILYKITKFSQ